LRFLLQFSKDIHL